MEKSQDLNELTYPSVVVISPSDVAISQGRLASNRRLQKAIKRTLDVTAAVSFLILFSPLLLGVSFLLLIAQGRPILFRHKRVGRNGEAFECLKFRTMVNPVGRVLEDHLAANPAARREWEATQKLKDDPRPWPRDAQAERRRAAAVSQCGDGSDELGRPASDRVVRGALLRVPHRCLLQRAPRRHRPVAGRRTQQGLL